MTMKNMPFRPRLESLDDRVVPSTLTVTNTLDTGFAGDGSLRGEIAAAQSGDTIQFAIPTTDRGYNSATGSCTLTLIYGELQITKNLTIQGPGASQLTISGGGYAGSRVFEIDGATTTVSLNGLSLTGGNGMVYNPYASGSGIGWSAGGNRTSGSLTAYDGQGGAIWNGGILTLSGCTLSNNSADAYFSSFSGYAGGAIYNAGTLTVSNSTLSYNYAGDDYSFGGNGGVIYNAGVLTVSGSTLSHNTAYSGNGGAVFNAGSLGVSGSTLSYNSAVNGGAIYSGYKLTATLTGSTLSNNSAYDGGAIWNDGAMTITNCYVDANSASALGGGIFNYRDAHLTIQSGSKVTGNSAGTAGADLDNFGLVKLSKDSTIGVSATGK